MATYPVKVSFTEKSKIETVQIDNNRELLLTDGKNEVLKWDCEECILEKRKFIQRIRFECKKM